MKCRKLENGKWECYAEGPRDPITNKRNPIRRQSVKKSTAQRKVKETLEALQSGIDGQTANHLPFREVAVEWMDVYEQSGVKKSTVRSRQSTVNLLNTYLGDLAIGRITHKVIQDMIMDLHRKDFSKSLLTHVKVTANFIFRHAQKQRLRMDNPVDHIVIPRRRQTVEEIESEEIKEKYFERDELERFLAATRTDGLIFDEEWFFLIAFTGLRAGELCSLRWSDIDFEESQIRITKTMDSPGAIKDYELTPPKSVQSIRIVDIDDNVINMLKRLKLNQLESRMKFRKDAENYHDKNFVFCRQKTGYPFSTKFLYRRYLRLCEKAGITKLDGPHILRHTHVTMLTEAEVDLDTIMNRVGHADAKTTKNIYTHITKKMKKNASKKVEIHYGEIFSAYFEA
ncbi:site-specific integrase [Planomicrobium sp. MB-3u-38]|uniref:tyrosine-type recombinase/integrase n=1 Tax=Planomicrobium sp. MB-3u-38 TaxID=2058318 RepID=UPI000C7A0988|nr:site-specific integrase [Planomicrobium sp. MB-3u-38]PKH09818.1 site-specific integrase [Planomicrobium sp. MB-3u-38]